MTLRRIKSEIPYNLTRYFREIILERLSDQFLLASWRKKWEAPLREMNAANVKKILEEAELEILDETGDDEENGNDDLVDIDSEESIPGAQELQINPQQMDVNKVLTRLESIKLIICDSQQIDEAERAGLTLKIEELTKECLTLLSIDRG